MPWINRIYDSARRFSGKKRNLRVFAIGILLILTLIIWRFEPKGLSLYFLIGACSLALSALVMPILIQPFLLLWMIVTGLLGEIVATTVIFVIYFLLFTPIALIKRNVTSRGWQDSPGNADYKKMY